MLASEIFTPGGAETQEEMKFIHLGTAKGEISSLALAPVLCVCNVQCREDTVLAQTKGFFFFFSLSFFFSL